MMIRVLCACCAMLLGAVVAHAEPIEWTDPTDQPVELGTIRWSRNFNQAMIKAHTEERPLFVLITQIGENPVAADFGRDVLSHPLINEALLTQFLPVAIISSGPGADNPTLLRSFNERSVTEPIVRIMEATRKELAPRLAGSYSLSSVSKRMVSAMRARSQGVPRYLELVADAAPQGAPQLQQIVFAMHCFWDGQARLGGLEGVIHANVGFLNDMEVVEVEFDPGTISVAKLIGRAKELDCATKVFTRTDAQQEIASGLAGEAAERSDAPIKASASDDLHWLMETPYKSVPMSRLQALRVNSSLASVNEEPRIWLSALQSRLLEKVQMHPEETWPILAGNDEMVATWRQYMAFVDELGQKEREKRKHQ